MVALCGLVAFAAALVGGIISRVTLAMRLSRVQQMMQPQPLGGNVIGHPLVNYDDAIVSPNGGMGKGGGITNGEEGGLR